jgi:3-oxoacyl-[acyl-carrier-protein] synthase III
MMASIQAAGKDLISDEAEGLKKLMKKLARKRLSAEAEVDSIDSLICACDSPMLMRFSYAHEVLRCS